ncbi:hypothetical protein VTJ49DRAFT_3736 [Mycothermus thermophilus]|uniref:HORMA domain-containing protein n=1 Tax=Humicola insolens TaxID=85995 RepID=A0ABR3V6U7_HUMIN
MPKGRDGVQVTPQEFKRDVELCKVVFTTAISQILYARRAFPPQCFQLVPLKSLVSCSFDDILATASTLHAHDPTALRDPENVIFLGQSQDYGLNRFLGILDNDIFPLIETERLVKFRINYLRTRLWAPDSLIEYYSIAVKYRDDGAYELDVWRAGTGKHHIATTDSQLWNLGDFLSRLPSWTDSLHWTLAFHAAQRPDNPPVGMWKFDHTDFEDANLHLQQSVGYSYDRLVRLKVLPSSSHDDDDVIPDTTPEPDDVARTCRKRKAKAPVSSDANRAQKRTNGQKSMSRGEVPLAAEAGGQLSPAQTLTSTAASKTSPRETTKGRSAASVADLQATQKPALRKPAAKRKPKKPLQLFEEAASSLPATQIIESQPLVQDTRVEQAENAVLFEEAVPRTPSPEEDSFTLLDGMTLSPETLSLLQGDPSSKNPPLPLRLDDDGNQPSQWPPNGEARSLLRIAPTPSVGSRTPGLSQWEPRASPAANKLLGGITVSDNEDEEAGEAGSVSRGEKDMKFDFEPDTVKQRKLMLEGLDGGSGDEEE